MLKKNAVLFIAYCLFAFSPIIHAKTLLIVGDSLSAGYGLVAGEEWPALLQNRLKQTHPQYTIVNASLSGETSSGGLSRFSALLEQHPADIVILELGANDGLRGQSLKLLHSNLSRMIEQAQASSAKVLLLGMMVPPNYGKRYSDAFQKVYTDLQEHYAIAFVPFFLEGIAGNEDLLLSDNLHPNAKAQPLILENIWESIEDLLQNAP